MSIRHWLIIGIGALVLGGMLAGCSPDSIVGSRVDNFRAFYNTFYNAEQDFETGMESVREQSQALDPDRFVSIFPDPANQVDRTSFESAIERSADVLREHPQSKWVDDALMLIGKSYFYLSEFGAAAEKFEEIIALDDERASEARFWLARTRASQGNTDGAAEQVRVSLERDDLSEPWRSKLWLVEAELHATRAMWPETLAALDTALQGDLGRKEATRAQLLRGQIFEMRDDYGAAARAYQAATDSREFEVALAGEMGALRAQAHTSNDPDLIEQANLLSRNDRNLEQRDALRVLEAYLHVLQDRPEEARRVYQSLLHGREPIGRDLQGRAYYQMGAMYRDVWNDYEMAAAYFDSSATTLGTREHDDMRPAPPTALPNVSDLAERYGAVAEQQTRVARYDSLLALGSLPEEAFQKRIEEIAAARREAQAEAEEEESSQRGSQFQAPGRAASQGGNMTRGQSTEIAANAASEEAGFLFHRDPQRVQEGRRTFRQRWGSRDRAPFWRFDDITPDSDSAEAPTISESGEVEPDVQPDADASTGATREQADTETEEAAAQSGIDIEAVPRTESEREAMRDERTWAWYELGSALFLKVSQPDSALTWYNRVLDEAADHPVYERALYARAEALDAAGKPGEAQAQYESLIESSPNSPFVQRARAWLGRDDEAIVADSTQQAFEMYSAAQALAEAENWNASLRRFTELTQMHPDDNIVASRALWAIGQVYLRWHRRDSTAARQALAATVDTLGIAETDETAPATEGDSSADDTQQQSPTRQAPEQQRTPAPQQVNPTADQDTTTTNETDPEALESQEADPETDDAEETEPKETEPPHPALRALMQHLETTFPDTPQARRAERLTQALTATNAPPEDSEPEDEAPAESPEADRSEPRLPTPRSSSGGDDSQPD